MIAEISIAAGSRDEVPGSTEPSKPDRPNHIAAVILGATSLIVAAPTAVVNIVFWTDRYGREIPDMLNMQLTAVAVGCLIGAAAAWWGANVVHRLKHVEAVEHRIEAREVVLRDELNERLDAMEHNMLQEMVELGEKVAKAKNQEYWRGASDTARDLNGRGNFDGEVIRLPDRNERHERAKRPS